MAKGMKLHFEISLPKYRLLCVGVILPRPDRYDLAIGQREIQRPHQLRTIFGQTPVHRELGPYQRLHLLPSYAAAVQVARGQTFYGPMHHFAALIFGIHRPINVWVVPFHFCQHTLMAVGVPI